MKVFSSVITLLLTSAATGEQLCGPLFLAVNWYVLCQHLTIDMTGIYPSHPPTRTANKAHEIISKPHISKVINKVQSASRDDDLPCTAEVEKLFECLGEECIQCFVDIILDLEEDTMCNLMATQPSLFLHLFGPYMANINRKNSRNLTSGLH